MVEEDRAKIQQLKAERDRMVDVKREKEFEVIMLKDAARSEQERHKKKCADIEHKIETLKLKQQKIED